MTCEEIQVRLTALSLGELEPAEAAAAREHIAHCGDCASAVLLDRQLTALLRASAVPAPEAARSSVLAALRSEATGGADARPAARPARRRHWRALGTAALAAAAMLAIAVLLVPTPDAGSALAAA